MPIAFKCRCGETLSAPDSAAGRDIVCTHCIQVVTVPFPVPPLVPGVIRIEKSEVDQLRALAPAPVSPKTDETYELEEDTDKSAAMKANRRLAGKICPICQDEIKFGEEIVICEYCKSPFHDACWKENGGCGTYGCLGASTVKQTRTFADITVPPEELATRRTPAEAPMPAPVESGERPSLPLLAVRNVSVWSVVSLVCSIAGMWWLHSYLGLFAVIIAIFAILDIRKSPALRGRIMAVAGMAVGFFDFIYGTIR